MRRLLLVAVVLAATPGAAGSSAGPPLLTYTAASMYPRGHVVPLGLCATDLRGHTLRLTDPHGFDRPSWSPDGRSLAFIGPAAPPVEDHSLDLFVTDLGGQNTRDLTSKGGRGGPVEVFGWSPDGKELGATWSGLETSVFIAKTDGTGTRILASSDSGGYVQGDSWSPDGTRILLSRYANGIPSLSVIDADGSNEHKLLDEADEAIWSPDGQQFAYIERPNAGSFGLGLGVARADGSDAHLLLQDMTFRGSPAWSPDGSRLAYIASQPGSPASVGTVRADGTDNRLLAATVNATAPRWSPDGRLIAFVRGQFRHPEVWVINPDSSGARYVAAGSDPVWRVPAPLPPHGRPCIVHGTPRKDVIHGTAKGDVIFAGGGKDRVYGDGGDDVIVGGLGQDRLFGGPGNDIFNTRDRLRDYVFGGPGRDYAYHDPVDVLSSVKY